MTDSTITDICIDAKGVAVILSSKSFRILRQDQSILDVPIHDHHSSYGGAICCIPPPSDNSRTSTSDILPNVLIASHCALSSWKFIENRYDFQSRVDLQETIIHKTEGCGLNVVPIKMYLSPCKSCLSLSMGSNVHVFSVASNLGLAQYAILKHEKNVTDSTILSLKDSITPGILITVVEGGDLFIWCIKARKCIKRITLNSTRTHSSMANSSVDYAPNIGPPLIASQMQHPHSFVACAFHDKLSLLALRLSEQNDKNDISIVDIITQNSLCELNGFDPIALGFIKDGNRICILVSAKNICVIDCLQKCIIKIINIDTVTSDLKMHKVSVLSDDPQFTKAKICFPFVGLLSNDISMHYKLDAVYGLVGSLCQEDVATEKLEETCVSLLMNEETKAIWMERIGKCSNRYETAHKILVKSSGYGGHRIKMELGKCPTLLREKMNQKKRKEEKARKEKQRKKANTIYPINCSLLDSHQKQHDDQENPCLLQPISSMAFDRYGDYIATAHQSSIHVMKLPFSKYKSASTQIADSHPCSDVGGNVDPSCRICWSYCTPKKMMAYHNKIYSLSPKSMSTAFKLPEKEATNASFFSKDECILFTKGNTLTLQRLYNDIQEKENKAINVSIKDSQKTLHSSFSFDSAQRITSIASINSAMSNLIACSCSDKMLHVVDVFENKTLWTKSLSRMARVAFPQPSTNIVLPADSYNLLVTASSGSDGGFLTLFDLRCGNIVKTCKGHVNRKLPSNAAFSPCLRYIAIGSEGYCSKPCLYDIRGRSNPIETKLGTDSENCNFRDGTITDCQFHPIYPQLVTGSLSGQLRFYSERSNE